MLRRLLTLFALITAVLVGGAGAPNASANDGNCRTEVDIWTGKVVRICEVGGGGGGSGSGSGNSDGSGNPGAGSGERVCMFDSRTVPCSTGHGTWADSLNAWCRPADPQPPYTDAVWRGRTDGRIYSCTRPGFEGIPDPSMAGGIWLASTELTPPPPPNPEDLAWRAVAALQLQPIDMGIAPEPITVNPDSLGAVGLPVWLWVETPSSNTTGPVLTASTSERGYTVSIRAEMTGIDWSLGDGGATITCGLGQRFDPVTMGPQTPVACGRQAGYQQQGEYTISATSRWRITWGGIGQTGVIDMERTASDTVRIGEIQTIING